MRMWKLAAGWRCAFDSFKEKSVVAMGWHRFGDLSRYANREELSEEYFRIYPDASKAKVAHAVGRLYRFE